MKKEVITQTEGYIEQALKKYSVTDAGIAKLKAEYMPLKIKAIDDAVGYKLVRAARMEVKALRIDVEKTRKGLKEESLIFGRAVDGEAKRITALLEPIEDYLHTQEKTVNEEKQRIKDEEANKERERIQARIKKLYDMGVVFDGFGYVYKGKEGENIEVSGEQIKDMPDEEYQNLISTVLDIQRKDAEAQMEIDRQRKEEEDRLAKIKKEQEAEAKRLKEKEDAIKAEQDKKDSELKAEREAIEAEKRLIEKEKEDKQTEEERVAEMNKALKEAEDKAKKEADEKAEQEATEKAEKERIAKIEAELAEKLKPDNEKLLALARDIRLLKMPELSNSQSHEILNKARGHLDRAVQILRQGT